MAALVPLAEIPCPAVVATVSTPEDLSQLSSPVGSWVADVIEIRLDGLTTHLDECESVVAAQNLPLLFTARHPDEGGTKSDLSPAERSALLHRFLPYASLIDIEVQSLADLSELIAEAKALGIGIVASTHFFDRCATAREVDDAVTSAREAGADIAKLATWMDDYSTLFELTSRLSTGKLDDIDLSFMGMGPLGKVSRIILANAGSRLNYGFLFTPNAPGQWPSSELRSILDGLA